MLVYADIREIKQDVKALMTQSSIDNLERMVYKNASIVSLELPNPPDKDSKPLKYEMVAILPDNRLTPKTK
jgi:hypothetical protein